MNENEPEKQLIETQIVESATPMKKEDVEQYAKEAAAWDATKDGKTDWPGGKANWVDAPEALIKPGTPVTVSHVTAKSPDVAVSEKPTRMVVIARTAEEMGVAQKKLVAWADENITALSVKLKDAQANLELYKKKKWRTDPLKTAVKHAEQDVEKWVKIKAALEAGYVIIPNMPDAAFDVFAIRTTAKNPRKNMTQSDWGQPKDQVTNSPPLGEGKYKSPEANIHSKTFVKSHEPGKNPVYGTSRWAEDFRDIDFPFRLAKPQILEDTAKAMELGIFDDIIASPKTRISRRVKGDPMIMGRILLTRGNYVKAVTFLITWFVDTDDL